MSEQSVNLALAGLGRISGAHMHASRAVSDVMQFVSAQTRDIQSPVSQRLREQGLTVYRDYRQMIQDENVDGVVLCYPSGIRKEPILQAAEAGKHVLVEKPLSLDIQLARELVSICESHGVQLMVAQSRRYSPVMEKTYSLLETLGKIIRIDINFLVHFDAPPTSWWTDPSQAGNLILDLQGSHSLDTIAWFMGDCEPERVSAETAHFNMKFNGSDEASVLVRYQNGTLCSAHLSLNNRHPVHEIIVVGEYGTLRIEERLGKEPFSFLYTLWLNGSMIMEDPGTPSLFAFQLREFVSAIQEGREPLSSGRSVLKSMHLLDLAKKSVR